MGTLRTTTVVLLWDESESRFIGLQDLRGNVSLFGPPFAGTFATSALPTNVTLVGTEAVEILVGGTRQLVYWSGTEWLPYVASGSAGAPTGTSLRFSISRNSMYLGLRSVGGM